MDHNTQSLSYILAGLLVNVVLFLITWAKDGRARRWADEDRKRVAHELKERLEREEKERNENARVIKEELLKNTNLTKEDHQDLAKKVEETFWDCPLCKKGVPVNTKFGHGKKFVEAQKK